MSFWFDTMDYMKTEPIYQYLERMANLLRTDTRRSMVEKGLQPVQLEALHYLSQCNRYSDTPAAVADFLGLTKGTVSQTLGLLENVGMIEKLPPGGRIPLAAGAPGPATDRAGPARAGVHRARAPGPRAAGPRRALRAHRPRGGAGAALRRGGDHLPHLPGVPAERGAARPGGACVRDPFVPAGARGAGGGG